jgi:hypothetical protein
MSGGNYDLSVDRGFDWSLTLTWNDADGNPVPLAGWSADMFIRPAFADQTTVIFATLSTADDPPEIVLGASDGIIQLSLSAAVTALIPSGAAVYDLRMTNPDGIASKLLYGLVQVWDEVTSS